MNQNWLRHRTSLVRTVGMASALVLMAVFATSGYRKLGLYGQDIGKLEYRLLGTENEPRLLTVLLQVSRRLTLPFCIVYAIMANRATGRVFSRAVVTFMSLALLLGALSTLDRAPFMMLIVMGLFLRASAAHSKKGFLVSAMIAFLAMVVLGGAVTYLQYNVQNFGRADVLGTGIDFVVNRAVLAPNTVAVELSYGIFGDGSSKLNLRYSRLAAVIGGGYVTSTQDSALYVGPVGGIADIWRNLGVFGIMFLGTAVGALYARLDAIVRAADPSTRGALTFTAVSLVFYLYYGTFFSQGVFLQVFFLLAVPRLLQGASYFGVGRRRGSSSRSHRLAGTIGSGRSSSP